MGKLKQIVGTIQYGLHSNIPLCCTLFYVAIWHPRFRGKLAARYRRLMNTYSYNHYVSCPACLLLRNRRELHKCGLSCKSWMRSHPLSKYRT